MPIIAKTRQYATVKHLRSTVYHRSVVWNASAATLPHQRTELCSGVLPQQQNVKLSRQIFALKTITGFLL